MICRLDIDSKDVDTPGNKLCELQTKLQDYFAHHILTFERPLVGFVVYKNIFKEFKESTEGCSEKSEED